MTENRWFARQLGLITREQALSVGLTTRQIEHRLATGRWWLAAHCVYASAAHRRTPVQVALAAALSAGRGAMLAQTTGAAVWELPHGRIDDVHVLVDHDRRLDLPGVTIHRSRSIGPADRARFKGIPVTTPSRTLIDLAGLWTPDKVEDAIDDALCRGLLSAGHLGRRAQALAARGRRGPSAMLEILELWSQDEGRSTQRELRVCRDIVAFGLPMPQRQIEIRDRTGRVVARIDGGYEDLKAGFEFQSFRWHATRRAFHRDQERLAAAVALGWTLYPATEKDVRDHCRRLCGWLADRLIQLRAA